MTHEEERIVAYTMMFVRTHANAGSYTNADVIKWINEHYFE